MQIQLVQIELAKKKFEIQLDPIVSFIKSTLFAQIKTVLNSSANQTPNNAQIDTNSSSVQRYW